VTHDLARLSPMHNTVTVDSTSQKGGWTLQGEQIPKVAYFFTSPMAQVAQLNGDHIYPQTQEYRRTVVLVEDVYVDQFCVLGGKVLDWMLHHTGSEPELDLSLKDEPFEPAGWLAHGVPRARGARTDGTWEAHWKVKDVTSRLTMLGAPDTEVFALQTHPVDQAVITKDHPPCQSLCVRRHGDTNFLAVADAWREAPNLQSVARGDSERSVQLKTRANTYHLLLGAGRAHFDDGVSVQTDGETLIVRNEDALTLIGGTKAEVSSPKGTLKVMLQPKGCLAAEYSAGIVHYEAGESVQYETLGGENYSLLKTNRAVEFSGNLWRIDTRSQRVTGKRLSP
jgi:hypothetical protein